MIIFAGTPEPGGLTTREAMTIFELVRDSANLIGMEITEINPEIGHGKSADRIAQVAKYIAGCGMGYCRGGLPRRQS